MAICVVDCSVWKTTVNNKNLEIQIQPVFCSRKDLGIRKISVIIDNSSYPFIIRVINKETRLRSTNCFNSPVSPKPENGMNFLVNELAIRMQTNFSGLCTLIAVRDSQLFVYLCLSLSLF